LGPDEEGRRRVGVRVDGEILKGWPTPTGKLEFWARTLHEWGWPELALPTYVKSHVHRDNLDPDQMPLITTFRVPVQIHTRSANAKWLDEIAHTNPLWIHPTDARRVGIERTGDLVRVETEIGHFVLKAWITEGIRPGVVACSHHMGRWKPEGHEGQRLGMMTVALDRNDSLWDLSRTRAGGPFESSDPDTLRVWWTDVGVHQNLTHAVHPDPVSGQHCWHQPVRVRRAEAGDAFGDVSVDTARARAAYDRWLALTRGADAYSPDGTRRPFWMLRPVRPVRSAYDLPRTIEPVRG
jgi:anaerobic selenocysteine-containing dehydrogenase